MLDRYRMCNASHAKMEVGVSKSRNAFAELACCADQSAAMAFRTTRRNGVNVRSKMMVHSKRLHDV